MAKRRKQTVGSRELKTRLGSYLERVRRGETLIVTDRGEPVAELRPIEVPEDAAEAAWQRMEAAGLVTRPKRRRRRALHPFEPLELPPGVSASDLVRQDRDEGW
jgi:prevent-host-death family protein